MPRPAYDNVQESLLTACTKLFLSEGIRETEMQQIAVHAGISRSTLYRYVNDKDQLVFMVATDLMYRTVNRCVSVSTESQQNGLEKLRHFCHTFAAELTGMPGLVRFLSEIKLIYGARPAETPEAKMYTEGVSRLLHREAQFLFEGLSDGSIRCLEDPMGFISLLIHTIHGLATCTLASEMYNGTIYTTSNLEEINRTVDILLDSIRAV